MKRKVIWTIATILISIPLLMDTPLAEGNNIRTWTYGTYSSDFNLDVSSGTGTVNIPFGDLAVSIPITKIYSYQVINFQMNNYMDGYVSFYINNMPSTNICDIYTSNCSVQSWNWQTGYISLTINGVDNFSVTLVNRVTFAQWLTTEKTITWSGMTLNAVNAPAYSLHNIDLKLADCNSTLQSILSSVDNLEGYTDNVETLLTDIKNYVDILDTINTTVSSINTSVTNAYNKLISIDSRLATVNSTLSSILSAVDNLEGYTDNIETLLSDIKTYTAILSDLSNKITVTNNSLDTLITDFSLLLQTIDNNINYINWTEMASVAGWTTDFNSYAPGGAYHSNGYYMFNTYGLNYSLYNQDPIIKLQVQLNGIGTNIRNYVKPIMLGADNTTIVDLSQYVIYEYYSRASVVYYIKFNENFSGYGNVRFGIQLGNLNRYIYSGSGNQLKFIGHDSDDYYLILNCITNLKNQAFDDADIISAINDVETAVRNMAVNVTNMTVNATGITYNVNNTQVNSSVNNYNTNINQVYNVENDFSLALDNYNQQFNPDFTNVNDKLSLTSGVMNDILVELYDLSIVKYPTIIMLSGIVLLAFLGV